MSRVAWRQHRGDLLGTSASGRRPRRPARRLRPSRRRAGRPRSAPIGASNVSQLGLGRRPRSSSMPTPSSSRHLVGQRLGPEQRHGLVERRALGPEAAGGVGADRHRDDRPTTALVVVVVRAHREHGERREVAVVVDDRQRRRRRRRERSPPGRRRRPPGRRWCWRWRRSRPRRARRRATTPTSEATTARVVVILPPMARHRHVAPWQAATLAYRPRALDHVEHGVGDQVVERTAVGEAGPQVGARHLQARDLDVDPGDVVGRAARARRDGRRPPSTTGRRPPRSAPTCAARRRRRRRRS